MQQPTFDFFAWHLESFGYAPRLTILPERMVYQIGETKIGVVFGGQVFGVYHSDDPTGFPFAFFRPEKMLPFLEGIFVAVETEAALNYP